MIAQTNCEKGSLSVFFCVHGVIIRIAPAWEEILLTGVSNADAEGPESISEQGYGERCIREGHSERLKMMS